MPHHDRAASTQPGQDSLEPEDQEGAPEAPEIISHAEMDAACARDLAVPLGQVIRYILRYRGSWWIPFEGGWIRSDPALTAMLDTEAARMTEQDAIIARNAAIRAAVTSVRVPDADEEPGIGSPKSGEDRNKIER